MPVCAAHARRRTHSYADAFSKGVVAFLRRAERGQRPEWVLLLFLRLGCLGSAPPYVVHLAFVYAAPRHRRREVALSTCAGEELGGLVTLRTSGELPPALVASDERLLLIWAFREMKNFFLFLFFSSFPLLCSNWH